MKPNGKKPETPASKAQSKPAAGDDLKPVPGAKPSATTGHRRESGKYDA
jgi:hypothetical protein